MTLFRQEAIAHQSERLTGEISLAQPLSIKLTVALLVATAIVIVCFLFNAQYARKETVRGFLMPNKGVIKSFAGQGGTVEKLWVSEGTHIEKGQPIATLILHKNSKNGVSLSTEIIAQLTEQRTLIDDEINQYSLLEATEKQNLTTRKTALSLEKQALEQQQLLANQKLTLLIEQLADIESLKQKGYVAKLDAERHKQALIDAQQEKQQVDRLLLKHDNQLRQIDFELANLPREYTLRVNNLRRQKADIENQLSQVKSNYQYTVTASHAGTITGIQVVEGETLSPSKAQSKPLLHILPEGSELVAEILLPTRSAGFIELGQDTRLRFDAFPYQRFGFIESEITRIDRALIAPNEVQLPIALQEPVYRLRATLNQQQISAYGKAFNLKSGMLFQADIMLEKRSLIEWLFEPIYSLKGRIS
ncbi:HlyD family efflux transporter periplasmic adaptor subunit [Thalassotalea sp. LPB0316]|uniref:HlyD family efflux transporter periplasmic adaptor subunit n=1 Tax=Thalassotalea sp. LPB0316 TaxID=2769490 RepID=UPI0018686E83|nr:HlyD family efflux transporter periplasmic adaptor subunit [Thalassotalea sp. LPB0316]QOL25842.1 HlyD family efflux transporter periplasmic adaptor subunit [Thalassotalea sp. LPB0316]